METILMKTFLATSAFLAVVTTTATAADFDANTFGLTATAGAVDFSVNTNENELTDFSVGAVGLATRFVGIDAAVRGELGYDLDADAIAMRGEALGTTTVGQQATVYGTIAIEYVTAETNLRDGDYFLNPSVGFSYAFNDTVGAFGEVGYAWDLFDDAARVGGYMEVGFPVNVTDAVTVTPSFVRDIDDGVEATNLNLAVALAF